MSNDIKKQLKKKKRVSYLNKDFDGFRADLLEYARTFFPDQIQDFSEASMGGMFLDMAAYVGDVMSFYLDHQFQELNIETAVERKNIERHLRSAGVESTGASPAVTDVTFFLTVPAVYSEGEYIPDRSACPVIRRNSSVVSTGGVSFNLVNDLDFSELDEFDELVAKYRIKNTNSSGNPTFFELSRSGLCVSGKVSEKEYRIGDSFVPFRKLTLPVANVTEILSVIDSEGNRYHEVSALTQDTVFKSVLNGSLKDSKLVPSTLEVVPAPYRYTKRRNLNTGKTQIQFGSGLADSLDDDVIPDPSSLSIPLYGKKVFSRFSIDPNSLLKTKTMGVSPVNTTIKVTYRHGGGLTHNVGIKSLKSIGKLSIRFPHNPDPAVAARVRGSVLSTNHEAASGGAPAPTINDLKQAVVSYRNSQSRIVSKQDLLARIYTMPSEFGRVFRAGLGENPNNPLAGIVYLISQDRGGKLVVAPDALKENLSKYLNEYRLVSDAVDILDASVVNLKVVVEVLTDSSQNPDTISNVINTRIKKFFDIKNFQIDQPIIKSELMNLVGSVEGVMSVVDLKVLNVSGEIGGRKYSSVSHNINLSTIKGIIFPPKGGIFEMRHPIEDIVIIAG